MTRDADALRPLWWLTTGIVLAAAGGFLCVDTGPSWLRWLLLGLAGAAAWAALGRRHGRGAAALWLSVGLAAGGFSSLTHRAGTIDAARRLATLDNAAVRVKATVTTGWTSARWGHRTHVVVREAHHSGHGVALPHSCIVEVRGGGATAGLPPPGSTFATLALLHGPTSAPVLVVASRRLLRQTAPPHGLHRLRQHLVQRLLKAAGTNVDRIRAAELASALALGRRDMIPRARRDLWRRSGLAHLLAVSGLHVGLAAGAVWLIAILCGALPTTSRLLVLATVPAYALLAGASPSAFRAALMVVAYVGARLAGRAILPMAAVLLAASAMVLAAPALIADAGFQLTVGITAALVRWVPPLVDHVPGPRWLAGALSVPLVAQLAAAPILAWHFRAAIPGAVLSNMLAPLLLTPTLALALVSALSASVWPAAAGIALGALHLCSTALLACGAIARSRLITTPSLPLLMVVLLVVAALAALRPGRLGRAGAVTWLALLLTGAAWWSLQPGPARNEVSVLPVADGLAALLPSRGAPLLVDGGRWRSQAAELLADRGVHRLELVIASHTDEDHIGGLTQVLETLPVGRLLLPEWMRSSIEAVPLLRVARRHGVRVVPLARGLVVTAAGDSLEVLWPPAPAPPLHENDRSLVGVLSVDGGRVLLTSDISTVVERRLLATPSALKAEVLVVPHHGSGGSSSSAFLRAVSPRVALIPAAPLNTHHHPSRRVLQRLAQLGIPFRFPARDGWCAAVWDGRRWRPRP